MLDDVFNIKLFILRKLINLGKIGGSHTAIYNLSKGLPDNIRNNKKGQKAIDQAIKELLNTSFLLSKPSTGEPHISINPRKIKEIKELLHLPEF